MASGGFSLKIPPRMESEDKYEEWKSDILIWKSLTDLAVTKMALAVHLTLNGRARVASAELGQAILGKADGLDKLLEKLDTLFLKDKSTRQYSIFREFFNLKRKEGQLIEDYITEFEQILFKLGVQNMNLPEPVSAFMLLNSSGLSEMDSKMVLSSTKEINLVEMKTAMTRILGGKINLNRFDGCPIKDEPVFEVQEAMYNQYEKRGQKFGKGNGFRGRGNSNSRGNIYSNKQSSNNSDRKTNPLNRYGKPSRCAVCGSVYHWAKSCPDQEESLNVCSQSAKLDRNDYTSSDADNEVHFSLFVGYNGTGDNKLKSLVNECIGHALLDSGCSKTVSGEVWLNQYCQSLSDFDKTCVKEEPSNSNFTFGDGKKVKASKKVTVPCYINGKRSIIDTEVVESNVPLLLSKKSMKKGGMIINFKDDSLTMGNERIALKSTNSGHYLLPLSA